MKFSILIPAALLGLVSCANPHRPASQGQPVLDLARHANQPNPNGGLTSEGNLTGLTRTRAADADFDVAARTGRIARFPCSRCHDRPVEQIRIAAQSQGKKAAHWEIALKHAPPGVMSCESCHQLSGATDELHTLQGQPVGFDHSYQLCGQCHSKQVSDWRGGAHGKRLGGWAPPRVIENCTGCHNPHSPRFQPRWPSVASPLSNVPLSKGNNNHE